MSEHQGDQGRSETTPFGDGSQGQGGYTPDQTPDRSAQEQGGYQQGGYGQGYGSSAYGQGGYGQSYGSGSYGQSGYGQSSYGQSSYGQPDPYAQPQPYAGYDQSAAHQQQGYQPAGYGQQPYGYGPAAPAKPGAVITAAVFGFVFGAFGVLASLGLLVFVAFAIGAGAGSLDDLNDIAPGLGNVVGAAVGIGVVVTLVVVAWTVITIWGSVWALTGRSRVMLVVAGSISIVTTGFGLVGNLANLGDGFGSTSGGDVVLSLVFFGVAVAIVVLLCLAPSAQFFAAHRARRGR
ncbi:hypothetical protein SAMN05660199_01594 [Klenkia soli]|uniref:Uncharacterized protein n=1 Tax=Klenkia soli TaxID=1052260 RepID=A0A1H0HW73_9ACTN|nr:hypothetical protein [Klenkia soli]SDO23456.1 hypothetical protein SAMN05660199_01594 [Klenkia soli]